MLIINPPDPCLADDPACTIEELCPVCLDGGCPHADCGYGECSGRWVNGACETHGNKEGKCQR